MQAEREPREGENDPEPPHLAAERRRRATAKASAATAVATRMNGNRAPNPCLAGAPSADGAPAPAPLSLVFPAGAVWAIKGCPVYENPLHLIPRQRRKQLRNIHIEGELCPYCGWVEARYENRAFTCLRCGRTA